MPEIGYWKYVRFNDDEPQFWGTDDDIVQIFDSADDRLEFRMRKDIRFEDDAGNEILTLDKTNRQVEIPVQLNVAALEEYAAGAGITVRGTLTFNGANLDLAGNLLMNPRLGTDLKTNGHDIYDGISGNTGSLTLSAGSNAFFTTGPSIELYGIGHATYPGKLYIEAGNVTGAWISLQTPNAALTTSLSRIMIHQGDGPDVDFVNCNVDLNNNLLKNAKLGTILDFAGHSARKIAYLEVEERATPPTPEAGWGRIYFKTDGRLYYLNDAGVEYGPL